MARATPDELFACLARLGLESRTVEHPPVFTVAQSRSIKETIPGAHTKNLFVKDRKGRLYLVVAEADARIDLRRLHEAIGASGRLSFGSADLLRETLGVEPGSVTPFAVVNDPGGRVCVVLDADLMSFERINVHPLVNTRTTGISREDLVAFLRAMGHEPLVVSLPQPRPDDCQSVGAVPS